MIPSNHQMTTPSSTFAVTRAMPSARTQKLKASSSVGASPSSHSRLEDPTNALELNLPPNALKILARCQATGRLSALMNPSSQPAPAAKSATTAKRPTARSYSQPNLLKSGGLSAYARGVPTPKPVPQPLEAAQYQPPPIKARARRAAQDAKGKARATHPAATDGPMEPTASWGDRAKTASLPALPSGSAAQAAALARPNTVWGNRTKNASLSALQRGSAAQQQQATTTTTSRTEMTSTPPTANALPAAPARPNAFWDDRATSTSLSKLQPAQSQAKPPAAAAAPARPSGSWGDRAQSQSMPALKLTAPSENSGLGCIPASLIERLLPRLAGAASRPKRGSSWVAGDAGAQGTTTASGPSARRDRTPLPAIMEVPAQEGPGLLPAMELPEPVPAPVFPEPSPPPPPTELLPEWVPTMDLPEPVPTMELSEQLRPPPVELAYWLDKMGPRGQVPYVNLVDLLAMETPQQTVPPQDHLQTCQCFTDWEGVKSMTEEELSECGAEESELHLDFPPPVQDEDSTRITPPTRAEIEMSLSASITLPTDLDYSTKSDRDVEMTDGEMHDLVRLAIDLLDESWTGYVDLEGRDRV